MADTEEVWKDIEAIVEADGTHAYQVSSYGNVRRAREVISIVNAKGLGAAGYTGTYTRRLKPKALKVTNTMRGDKIRGFASVSIKDVTYPVHILVAKTFLADTYKPGLTVNHKDGNRFNNRVENLEWVTASENERHSYKVLGKKPWNKGTKGLMAKTWKTERKEPYTKRNNAIVSDRKSGMTAKQLSDKYGLGKRQIYSILQIGVDNEQRQSI